MNKMNQKINSIQIFLFCPIPDEQKPINEYINLKKFLNPERINKFRKLNFPELNKKTKDNILPFFLKEWNQILLNFLLILRWNEIEKRFNLPNVIYEEGSWYDSQIWEKPFSMIKKDRLINSQTVKPFLKRIFFVFFLFLFFIFLNYS